MVSLNKHLWIIDKTQIKSDYLPFPPLVAKMRSANLSGTSCRWSYSQWKEPTPKAIASLQ
ncbi:MAG TPA: hypothetical protein VK184_20025 [Nostocaceae cyanobacterium]|nr:hypothetical protein [Nostocaceae cyanobacterium]